MNRAVHQVPPRDRLLWGVPWIAMVFGLHLGQSAWLSFAIYHGLIVATVWRRADLVRDLVRGWHTPTGIVVVAFGLGGGLLLGLLAPTAGLDADRLGPALARLGLHGAGWPLFVAYHALVNPWAEEIFWRGRLRDDRRRPVAADAAFAGYHLLVLMLFVSGPWLLLAFVVLMATGWLWRTLRSRGDGLLLPVLSHLAADASIMVVAWWLSRPETGV